MKWSGTGAIRSQIPSPVFFIFGVSGLLHFKINWCFFQQAMKTLMRRRIWVCTVCLYNNLYSSHMRRLPWTFVVCLFSCSIIRPSIIFYISYEMASHVRSSIFIASHMWTPKTRARLCIRTVSQSPSVLAHIKYRIRRRFWTDIKLDGWACDGPYMYVPNRGFCVYDSRTYSCQCWLLLDNISAITAQ